MKNSTKSIYSRMNLLSFITGTITLLLGAVLFFLPEMAEKTVGIIVGILFLFLGASTIYYYLNRNGAKLYAYNIFFSVVFCALGLILLIFPYSVFKIVAVCLGLFLITNGCLKIAQAIWLKIGEESSWLVPLISGILLFIFGIMVMINTFEVSLTITKIAGIFIMINGIVDIMNAVLFRNRSKEIMNIFW